MPIYKGSTEVTAGNLKLGNQDVKEVYLGTEKIWPSAVAPFTYEFLGESIEDYHTGSSPGSRMPEEEYVREQFDIRGVSEEQSSFDLVRGGRDWRTAFCDLTTAKEDDLLIVMYSFEELGEVVTNDFNDPDYHNYFYSNPTVQCRIEAGGQGKWWYDPTVKESYLEQPGKIKPHSDPSKVKAASNRGCRSFALVMPVGEIAGNSNVKVMWDCTKDWSGSNDFTGYNWRRHQTSVFLVHSAAGANIEYKTNHIDPTVDSGVKETSISFSGVTENDLIFFAPIYGLDDGGSTLEPKCTFTISNGDEYIREGLGNQKAQGSSRNYASSDHLVLDGFTSSNVSISYGTNKTPSRTASTCAFRIYR